MQLPNQLFDPNELAAARLGYFKSGDYNQSISPAEIAASIAPAELNYLKPVLGEAMYEDMVTNRITGNYVPETGSLAYPKVDMFPVGYTAYNELFNKHIWRFFGVALSWRLQTMLTAQLSNEGTRSAEDTAVFEIRKARANLYNSDLNTYRDEMVRYLCKNKADFPLWAGQYFEQNCGCTDEPPPAKRKTIDFYWG